MWGKLLNSRWKKSATNYTNSHELKLSHTDLRWLAERNAAHGHFSFCNYGKEVPFRGFRDSRVLIGVYNLMPKPKPCSHFIHEMRNFSFSECNRRTIALKPTTTLKGDINLV